MQTTGLRMGKERQITRGKHGQLSARAAAKAPSPFQSFCASVNHSVLRVRHCLSRVRAGPSQLTSSALHHPQCSCLKAFGLATLGLEHSSSHTPMGISSLPAGLCSKVTLSERPSLQRALSLLLAHHPISPYSVDCVFPKVL